MPGYKVFLQDGREIRDGLICPYCNLVLKDPVQTSESGLRLCKECCEAAKKDPLFADELDQDDEVWPDSAVKREIANLRVKCENYMFGCDWEGLFKQLMQHSQQCQYVTVECECYQRMLLGEMDTHLDNCPQQLTKCKDCGKEMYFIELQNHSKECLYAPRRCKNCQKQMPICQLADHMINDCKHVRCMCNKQSDIYEVDSEYFHNHLQDVSKLADHLGPMICEFTKMSEAFKEMNIAYQQATKRIDTLEKRNDELEQKVELTNRIVECLELKHNLSGGHIDDECVEQLCGEIEGLTTKVEELKRNNERLTSLEIKDRNFEEDFEQVNKNVELLQIKCNELVKSFEEIKSASFETKISSDEQIVLQVNNNDIHYEAITTRHSSNEVHIKIIEDKLAGFERDFNMFHEKLSSSDAIAHKEKLLEIEKIVNVHGKHIYELTQLELLLQGFFTTHNQAFMWRIPKVYQKLRDARSRMGGNTSIDSPPFYTGRNGYKMCIRAYLNGDGSGEGTHLSIFSVLMKGEYDPLLQWPFEPTVKLILVDQDNRKNDFVRIFKSESQSCGFSSPKTDMCVASGCPQFADLSILEHTGYVKADVMYIEAIVDF